MTKKKDKKVDMSQLELKIQIKQAEAEAKKKEVKVLPKEVKISFDSWYHARMARISKIHLKEIIWADFNSRKLSKEEKAEDYDKALEKYGVKLDK